MKVVEKSILEYLNKAIEIRQKYKSEEEYLNAFKINKNITTTMSNMNDMGVIYNGWQGVDEVFDGKLKQKPARPLNYKTLPANWSLVSLSESFVGYPFDSILDLIQREEFYFIPQELIV